MPRRLARSLLGFVVAGIALVAVLVVVPAAYAAPTAVPDRYDVYGGGTYTLTPIANDQKALFPFDDLTLCGVGASDIRRVYIEQVDDKLVVEVRRGVRGETTIQYDVCQGSDRSTGTITLAVTKLVDVKGVKKKGTRGRVTFTNSNDVPVQVTYGSASSAKVDDTVDLAAGRSVTVATRRSSIYWVALHSDDGQTILAGDATISGVQSTK